MIVVIRIYMGEPEMLMIVSSECVDIGGYGDYLI